MLTALRSSACIHALLKKEKNCALIFRGYFQAFTGCLWLVNSHLTKSEPEITGMNLGEDTQGTLDRLLIRK
jgi:hypothetical protein